MEPYEVEAWLDLAMSGLWFIAGMLVLSSLQDVAEWLNSRRGNRRCHTGSRAKAWEARRRSSLGLKP